MARGQTGTSAATAVTGCTYTLKEQLDRLMELCREINYDRAKTGRTPLNRLGEPVVPSESRDYVFHRPNIARLMDNHRGNYNDLLLITCNSGESGVKINSCQILQEVMRQCCENEECEVSKRRLSDTGRYCYDEFPSFYDEPTEETAEKERSE